MFKSIVIGALLGCTFAVPSTDATPARMLQEVVEVPVGEEKKRGGRGGKGKGGRGGKGGKSKWNEKGWSEKGEEWENMSQEDKDAKIAQWKADWEEKKKTATPEELEKMLEKEKKMEEWKNMTDEEKAAKKQEYKDKYSKWGKKDKSGKSGWGNKKDWSEKKEEWENMSQEEKDAKMAEWKAKWEEKKKNATPEELEKMLEKERKMEEWKNMTDEEKAAKKEEWKAGKAEKKREHQLAHAKRSMTSFKNKKKFSEMSEEDKSAVMAEKQAQWEAKKHAWAKKIVEKKGLNEEEAEKFYKHISNLSFGKGRRGKGGKGRKLEEEIELTEAEVEELYVIIEAGPDPKRDYFEKLGAQFSSAFFAGVGAGDIDEIDLFECLHAEPTAVEYFYKADMTMKEGLTKHSADEIVKAFDELIGFVVELAVEDYPHSKTQVCKTLDQSKYHWDGIKEILKLEKDKETTLQDHDGKFFFNKQDITEHIREVAGHYAKSEWRGLGYTLGKTMLEASKSGDSLFLQ